MFGLFKKKIKYKYNDNIKNILIKIFSSLPKKYSYLYKQIEDGIIHSIEKEDGRLISGDLKKVYDGWIKTNLYIDLLNKYDNDKLPYFRISDIILKDKNTDRETSFSFEAAYGNIHGFTLEDKDFLETDYQNIDVDVSKMKTKVFEDKNIKKMFSKEELKYINLNDVYEVDLDGVLYYHIYDIENGDGDFIGIDEKKNVYEITHDPYEITLLENKLIELLREKDN